MRPTCALPCASKPASWRCVSLHQSTWDAPQVPEPCSIICRAIQRCKLQGFACPGPAELNGALLRKTGCLLPKPQRNLWPDSASGTVGGDPHGCAKLCVVSLLHTALRASESRVIEVCNAGGCGHLARVVCPGKTRTSTSHFAMEAVISFLQTSGRPHQLTLDRDPTLGGKRVGPGFSLTAASAPAVLRDDALCLSATSPRQACLRGALPQNLRTGVLTASSTKHAKGGYARQPRRFCSTTTKNVLERRRTCGTVPPRVAFPTLPPEPALGICGWTRMPG